MDAHVNCIFCKIIKKEIPAQIIYEDEYVVAFLDIAPIAKGHCLVIPKKHFKDIFELPEKEQKEIMFAVKKISESAKKNLSATGVNLLNASGKDAQQSVFHFHMHVVPRYENDGLDTWPKSDYKEENLEEVRELLANVIK